MNKENETKAKKPILNSKNKRTIIYIVLIIVTIYVCYAVYLLVKQPTDTFTVKEGELYQEERDTRIHS